MLRLRAYLREHSCETVNFGSNGWLATTTAPAARQQLVKRERRSKGMWVPHSRAWGTHRTGPHLSWPNAQPQVACDSLLQPANRFMIADSALSGEETGQSGESWVTEARTSTA